jgi:transcriptional regulator with XRE-family HTH domain
MKRAIDERGPIAAWLIRSRAQFREPNAERTWTVTDFLKALKAETGWAPTRTTYARWESGATRPEPENLRRVESFYVARGIAGLSASVGATESDDPLIIALTRQTEAIEALVARLDTFVGPLGDVVADLVRDQVRAATDRTRSDVAAS